MTGPIRCTEQNRLSHNFFIGTQTRFGRSWDGGGTLFGPIGTLPVVISETPSLSNTLNRFQCVDPLLSGVPRPGLVGSTGSDPRSPYFLWSVQSVSVDELDVDWCLTTLLGPYLPSWWADSASECSFLVDKSRRLNIPTNTR